MVGSGHRFAVFNFLDQTRVGSMSRLLIGFLLAGIVGLQAIAPAQSQQRDADALVVYCRDPLRRTVVRVLSADCVSGEIVTEKEAEAARNESAERRRRLLLGDQPEQAKPAEPARSVGESETSQQTPEPPQTRPTPKPAAATPDPPAPGQSAPRESEGAVSRPAATPSPEPSHAPAPPVPAASRAVMTGGYAAVAKALAGAADGEWRRIPGTKLKLHTRAEAEAIGCVGVNGPSSVVSAWNGAHRRGSLWYFEGGGHTNNGCNDRHVIDLDAGTSRRLFDGAPLDPNTLDPIRGMPAYHTYSGWVAHSNGKHYVWGLMAYRPYGRGNGPHGAWVVDDPNRNEARRLVNTRFGQDGYTSACELANGNIFLRLGGGHSAVFDPVTEKEVARNENNSTWATGPVCYAMPPAGSKQRVYLFGPNAGITYVDVDLRTNYPASDVVVIPMAEIPPALQGPVCVRYHKRTGKFIFWNGRRETGFWDPTAKKVSVLGNAGSPIAPGPARSDRSAGVYTKCEIIDEVDALVGLDNWQDDAFAWKIPAVLAPDPNAPGTRSLAADLRGLQPGGSIRLPATEYRDGARVTASDATIDGTGVRIVGALADGKAAIVVSPSADRLTVIGLNISGTSDGENAGAFRIEAPTVTLRQIRASRNDTHIMSSGVFGGTLTIEGGSFTDANGTTRENGQTHGFYLGYHDRVRASGFELRRVGGAGHLFKSRALSSLIENCTVAQEGSNSSRSFDFSMGGEHVIRNCTIQHGSNGNSDIIGIGHEIGGPDDKRPAASHSLTVEDSLIVCDQPNPCTLVSRKAGVHIPVKFKRSTIVGAALPAEMDGGGNRVCKTRAECGLPPYPALPAR